VAGRGEREPAVETGDEVANERNRRVEIMVR
jgi:flagellar motor protein MotB